MRAPLFLRNPTSTPHLRFLLDFQRLWLLGSLTLSTTLCSAEPPTFGGNPENPLTYGIEIEVDPDRYPKLYSYYDIEIQETTFVPKFLGHEKRESPPEILSEEEARRRFGSVRSLVRGHFPDGKTIAVHFKKKLLPPSENEDEAQFHAMLPQVLYNEGSGTVEFNEFHFDDQPGPIRNLRNVRTLLDHFREKIGEGDVQAHVVFNRPSGGAKARPLENTESYVIYEHDRALLRRLEGEHELAKKDPSFIPAVNLNSKYLGPLQQDILHQTQMIEYRLKQGTLTNNERPQRASIPTLRTDKYQPDGEKVGFELRMYDNPSESTRSFEGSFDEIQLALKRAQHHLALGGFQEVSSLTSQSAFIPPRLESSAGSEEARAIRHSLRALWICDTVIDHYYPKLKPEACVTLKAIEAQITQERTAALAAGRTPEIFEEDQRRVDLGMIGLNEAVENWMKTKAEAVTGKSCPQFASHITEMDPKFLFPMRVWHENPIILSGMKSEKSFSAPAKKLAETQRIKKLSKDYYEEFNQILCSDPSKTTQQAQIELRRAIAHWSSEAKLFQHFDAFESEKHLDLLPGTKLPKLKGPECLGALQREPLAEPFKKAITALKPLMHALESGSPEADPHPPLARAGGSPTQASSPTPRARAVLSGAAGKSPVGFRSGPLSRLPRQGSPAEDPKEVASRGSTPPQAHRVVMDPSVLLLGQGFLREEVVPIPRGMRDRSNSVDSEGSKTSVGSDPKSPSREGSPYLRYDQLRRDPPMVRPSPSYLPRLPGVIQATPRAPLGSKPQAGERLVLPRLPGASPAGEPLRKK